MSAAPWPEIGAGIARATGTAFTITSQTAIGGGSINQCYCVQGGARAFFVKVNSAGRGAMFDAEADGLAALAAAATVRVPRPVCRGSHGDAAWLVLEYIDLEEASDDSMAQLGAALAHLHQVTTEKFGWDSDNFIGATPQINTAASDWFAFWRDCRLGPQLALATRNRAPRALLDKGQRLCEGCGALFAGLSIKPSLLHGDLWRGNAGFDRSGAPVIFDPAAYYGHREADLAMTELFGGFSAGFYAAYRDTYPLDPGYDVRKRLYNLYHVLNHFNLFGGGYARQAEALSDGLLAEL